MLLNIKQGFYVSSSVTNS